MKLRRAALAFLFLGLAVGLGSAPAEAASVKNVQHGTFTASATTTTLTSPTFTAVDPAKSFIICSDSGNFSDVNTARYTCEITNNGTNLTFTNFSVDATNIIVWHVIEFDGGVTVQRGNTSANANCNSSNSSWTSCDTTITQVDVTKTFTLISERMNSATGSIDEEWRLRAQFANLSGNNSSTLQLVRSEAGIAMVTAWQVITMDSATVQRGTISMVGTATSTTVGSAQGFNSVTAANSFLFFTWKAGTATAGVEQRYFVRGSLAASLLTFKRDGGLASADMDIAWEVVSMDDGSDVVRGTALSVSTDTASATANQALARSFPWISNSGGASGDDAELDDVQMRATISGTQITVSSYDNGTNNLVDWQVIEFFQCSSFPSNVSYAAANARMVDGSPQVTVSWSSANPVVVLRMQGTFGASDLAKQGQNYAVGDASGAGSSATVRFVGAGGETSFTDSSGLSADQTYNYRVFPKNTVGAATPCYADGTGSDMTARPDSRANEAWSYMLVVPTLGNSALKAPIASDDGIYFGTNAGRMTSLSASTGLERWTPAATTSGLQGWLIPVPLSAGGSRVFAGDQSGKVYSVDTSNGTIEFQPTLSGTAKFQAGAAVQLRAYSPLGLPDSGYDLIYMATKNGGTNNKVYALRSDTMAVKWTFNGGETLSVGDISGMPVVDYERNQLYVTSLSTSGTGASLWIIDIMTGLLVGSPGSCPTANSACVNLGDIEASPAVSYDNATLLVSNTGGSVYAIDLTIDLTLGPDPDMMKWTEPLALGAGNQVKGIIWEDWSIPGRLYMVVANTTPANSTVRCFLDPGVAGTPNAGTACSGWSGATVTVNGAQAAMLLDKLYVSSWKYGTTAEIKQIDFSSGGSGGTAFTIGAGTSQPGDVSTDLGNELFVGTDGGQIFKITLPLP